MLPRTLTYREAEEKYIDFVTKLAPQWKEGGSSDQTAREDGGNSSGAGFGLKVSKIATEYNLNEVMTLVTLKRVREKTSSVELLTEIRSTFSTISRIIRSRWMT